MAYTLKKLNTKHLAFCHYYIYGEHAGNGEKCVEQAKFHCKNGSARANQLLRDPLIAEEIEKKRKALLESFDYTEAQMRKMFAEIAVDTNEKTSDRLTALTAIAKMKGFLKETTTNVNIDLDSGVDNAKKIIENKYSAPVAI